MRNSITANDIKMFELNSSEMIMNSSFNIIHPEDWKVLPEVCYFSVCTLQKDQTCEIAQIHTWPNIGIRCFADIRLMRDRLH